MAIFTVTNTGDNGGVNPAVNAGTGTLRQAIIDANGTVGADVINFAIAGAGVKTIALSAGLPAITDSVTINGFSQPGASANTLATGSNANLLIELNGLGAVGAAGLALDLGSSNSIIQGLVINSFSQQGIILTPSTLTNIRIQGNYIGTDPSGTVAKPNSFHGVQIYDGNSNNFIGSDGNGVNDLAERNLISGNTQYGIILQGTGTNGNVIAGNEIGTNALGTATLGNGIDGILIYQSAQNNRIGGSNSSDRNIISGNGQRGVFVLDSGTSNNQILGNYIGLNASGTGNLGNLLPGISLVNGASNNLVRGNAIANNDRQSNSITPFNTNIGIFGFGTNNNIIAGNLIGTNASGTALAPNGGVRGIQINNGPQNNTIGGTAPADRNIISGTLHVGLEFVGSVSNNRAIGNYIGTDITGTVAIGNAAGGVGFFLVPTTNTVGGSGAGEGNLISGNTTDGISIVGSSNQIFQGNRIGISANGSPLGNQTNGILLKLAASNNNLFGSNNDGVNDATEGNLIANNSQDGIAIEVGTGNRISRNSIFNNGQLGIDLGNNGITPNDNLDPDTGANNLQNFPLLSLSGTNVIGSLNSTANTTFRIEFYDNTTPDPSGNGEGQTFLGFQNVTTDASGEANFTFNPGAALNVTATATDPPGNTSEFSNVVALPIATSLLPDLTIAKNVSPQIVVGSQAVTYTLTVSNIGKASASNITVRDALPAGLSFFTATATSGFNTPTSIDSSGNLNFTGGSLAAGASATLTVIVNTPNNLPANGYTNTATVDPLNTIAESNENNNSASANVGVIPISAAPPIGEPIPNNQPVTTPNPIPSGFISNFLPNFPPGTFITPETKNATGRAINGTDGNNILTGGAGNDTIRGGRGDDTIYGYGGDNLLIGGRGNDVISGGKDNDTLIGTNANNKGKSERDILNGNGGANLFVLGDALSAYYDDGDSNSSGLSDYALITDFNPSQDNIQLKAGLSYLIGVSPTGLPSGAAIFIDNDGIPGLSANDELIGILQGFLASNPSAITSRFQFV